MWVYDLDTNVSTLSLYVYLLNEVRALSKIKFTINVYMYIFDLVSSHHNNGGYNNKEEGGCACSVVCIILLLSTSVLDK